MDSIQDTAGAQTPPVKDCTPDLKAVARAAAQEEADQFIARVAELIAFLDDYKAEERDAAKPRFHFFDVLLDSVLGDLPRLGHAAPFKACGGFGRAIFGRKAVPDPSDETACDMAQVAFQIGRVFMDTSNDGVYYFLIVVAAVARRANREKRKAKKAEAIG